jgi:hypothetical protein
LAKIGVVSERLAHALAAMVKAAHSATATQTLNIDCPRRLLIALIPTPVRSGKRRLVWRSTGNAAYS